LEATSDSNNPKTGDVYMKPLDKTKIKEEDNKVFNMIYKKENDLIS